MYVLSFISTDLLRITVAPTIIDSDCELYVCMLIYIIGIEETILVPSIF